MTLPPGAVRRRGEEQSSASARAPQRVSADGCGSGSCFDSSAFRRATARGSATVFSLQMKAQPLRQGDRRPNGKPQTLRSSSAVPSRRRRSAVVWRSPPAICRIADTTTERTSLSSLLAPESQPRHVHAAVVRPTALSRPPQSECTAQTEAPPWSPSLPALGHCPAKRGMDAPDAYSPRALMFCSAARTNATHGAIPAALNHLPIKWIVQSAHQVSQRLQCRQEWFHQDLRCERPDRTLSAGVFSPNDSLR
jgi:hypothetical protein